MNPNLQPDHISHNQEISSTWLNLSFLLFVFFFLFYSNSGKSQDPTLDWVFNLEDKLIGSTYNQEIRATAIDAAGNVYVAGSFQGIVDFDPSGNISNLESSGNDDIFVAKYTSAGEYIWANQMGGTSSDIAFSLELDGSDNVYITGYFQGTVDFDPSTNIANLTSSGNQDIFVSKYTAAGEYVWVKRIGGAYQDYAYALALDDFDNVYITGYFQGTVDFDPSGSVANLGSSGGNDIFVAKYTASGDYVWANKMGGTSADIGRSLALDGSNNVYVTGYFQGTVDFDPSISTANLVSSGAHDGFVAKYASTGAYEWANNLGGASTDVGFSLALDGADNVYVAGYFEGVADFDPSAGTTNLVSNGMQDVFIAKYTATGAYLWTNGFGGASTDVGFALALDDSYNAYITGYFQGTVDFDGSAGSANLVSNGAQDIFAVKYTATGSYAWCRNMGGTSDDRGYVVTTDESNNVFIGGYFNGTANFDISGGTEELTAISGQDAFLLKIQQVLPISYWNADGDALNWNDANNWANDEVPGAGDEVVLDNSTVLGGYTVIISGDEEVGDLTLANGNIKVNIEAGASLTYGTIESNGTLTVKSGGSLFPTGAGTLTGTGFKVERSNPNPTKANFWSSPVVNGHTSMIGGNNTQALNPLTQEYSPASGMMSVGKGYFSNQATTAVFSGTPNNGNIDVLVNKGGSLPGYNLIGNPYPSGLIAKSFTDANNGGILSAAALYLFSAQNGLGGYESAQDIVIVNTLGSAFYDNDEDLDTYVIASGQGFGVEAAMKGDVSFTNAMRSTDNNNFKAGEDAVKVWVAIKNQTHEYSTLVAFTEDATYGADYEFDAPTYFGVDLAIASTIKDKTYGIQAVPQLENGYNETVGLKLNIPVAGNHTFEVAKSEKLPQGVKVYIHDKNTDYYFDITNNKRQLAISEVGEVDRYELVVGDAALSTSIADKVVAGAEAYVSENRLNISSAEGIIGFTLIDMKGSVVMQQNVTNNQEVSVQLLNSLSGIYLLRVQTTNGIETVKLSID